MILVKKKFKSEIVCANEIKRYQTPNLQVLTSIWYFDLAQIRLVPFRDDLILDKRPLYYLCWFGLTRPGSARYTGLQVYKSIGTPILRRIAMLRPARDFCDIFSTCPLYFFITPNTPNFPNICRFPSSPPHRWPPSPFNGIDFRSIRPESPCFSVLGVFARVLLFFIFLLLIFVLLVIWCFVKHIVWFWILIFSFPKTKLILYEFESLSQNESCCM